MILKGDHGLNRHLWSGFYELSSAQASAESECGVRLQV